MASSRCHRQVRATKPMYSVGQSRHDHGFNVTGSPVALQRSMSKVKHESRDTPASVMQEPRTSAPDLLVTWPELFSLLQFAHLHAICIQAIYYTVVMLYAAKPKTPCVRASDIPRQSQSSYSTTTTPPRSRLALKPHSSCSGAQPPIHQRSLV